MDQIVKIRSDLPKWLVDNGYMVGAEVGVYKGEFTELFCKAGVKMIYAVDPYKSYYPTPTDCVTQERQDFIYGHAQRLLAPYNNYKFIRKDSLEAVNDFEDESLDFVYIDGDHSFKSVVCDIVEWSKKVRKGGIVSGHDYTSLQIYGSQVKPAVDAYILAFNIKDFITFGSKKLARQNGDMYNTWLWIKE